MRPAPSAPLRLLGPQQHSRSPQASSPVHRSPCLSAAAALVAATAAGVLRSGSPSSCEAEAGLASPDRFQPFLARQHHPKPSSHHPDHHHYHHHQHRNNRYEKPLAHAYLLGCRPFSVLESRFMQQPRPVRLFSSSAAAVFPTKPGSGDRAGEDKGFSIGDSSDSTRPLKQTMSIDAAAIPAGSAAADNDDISDRSASSKRDAGSGFSLPSIFSRPRNPYLDKLKDYPWLLSTSPPRKDLGTLWQMLDERQKLGVGIKRVQTHFPSADYPFPLQLTTDAAPTLHLLFESLSDPDVASDSSQLQPLLTRGLADRFAAGYARLRDAHGLAPTVHFPSHSATSSDSLARNISLVGLHITYGPYPVPEGYVAQNWFNLITLQVPQEDSTFISHPHQKRVMQAAMDAGVYVRATLLVNAPVELVVRDLHSGIVVARDRRKWFHAQLVTPHFTPYDEIFERIPGAGKYDRGWRLKWEWRVADLDYLIETATK